MAHIHQPRKVILKSFCVDFDETLTSQDTTSAVLFESVVSAAKTDVEKDDKRAQWANLSTWYGVEASAWRDREIQKAEPEPKLRSTCAAERSAALLLFAARMSEFEKAAVGRVSESGVLAGVTRQQLEADARAWSSDQERHGGGAPRFKRGAREAMELAGLVFGRAPTIVSINWSRDVVRGALEGACIPFAAICCNDLSFSPHSRESTGVVCDDAVNSMLGKVQVQRNLVAELGGGKVAEKGSEGQRAAEVGEAATTEARSDHHPKKKTPNRFAEQSLSVFVGDSVTDLAAMVEADVGVLIGGSESVKRTCSAFGVEVRPLSAATERVAQGGVPHVAAGDELKIYEAADGWSDVSRFLRALQRGQELLGPSNS